MTPLFRDGGELDGNVDHSLVPVGEHGGEGGDGDPDEVEVSDDNEVELLEEGELLEVPGRLAFRLGRLAQVADGPDVGKEDGTAADHVHQQEDLVPAGPVTPIIADAMFSIDRKSVV